MILKFKLLIALFLLGSCVTMNGAKSPPVLIDIQNEQAQITKSKSCAFVTAVSLNVGGQNTNADGVYLEYIGMSLFNLQTELIYSEYSDSDGLVRFTIPAGTYRLRSIEYSFVSSSNRDAWNLGSIKTEFDERVNQFVVKQGFLNTAKGVKITWSQKGFILDDLGSKTIEEYLEENAAEKELPKNEIYFWLPK